MPACSSPWHVLVIEDDPDLRTLLCDILADDGYRATARGATGLDDLGAIAASAPDLIITDSMGHSVAGLTAMVRSLRDDPRLARTPIVLCTGAVRAVKDLDGAITGLGMRVVLKPFDIDQLLAEIAAALVATP